MRTVAEIVADRAAFESQFCTTAPYPPGTANRHALIKAWHEANHAKACLPENIDRRLALIEEEKKSRRSETAKAAAARRKADPEQQIRAWVYRRLRAMGFQRETKTGSGSTYYTNGHLTVRISDHAVPMTAEREQAWSSGGRSWANSRWSLDEITTFFAAGRWLVDVRKFVATLDRQKVV